MKIHNGFVSNSSSTCFLIVSAGKSLGQIKNELEMLLQLYNRVSGQQRTYESVFEGPVLWHAPANPRFAEEWLRLKKELPDWEERRLEALDVKVQSAGDNAIPYAMMHFIEGAYDCIRIYLG